jgi:diguanylate cyclase (GGDEF)-like protein
VLCVALDAPRRIRFGARGAGYGAGVLGVVALIESATGVDLMTGQVFARGLSANPLAPGVALAIVSLAAGLALAERSRTLAQVLLTLGGLPGYVALVGYATGVSELYTVGASMSMAVATATALPLIALAGLATVPDGWVARIHAGADPGALLLRTVLPPAIVVIPVIAAATAVGATNQWWTNSFAVALQSLGATLVAVGGALWGARAVGHIDRMRQDADRRAHEDALTGAGNRWALERALESLFDQPAPPTTGIVMLMDLDDFKVVNDRYGHLEGDRVLLGFADRVRANLRADDVLIRLGGDEFAVVCSHADPNGVRVIVNRILLALEHWKSEERGPAVTASIGVAVCDGTIRTPHELLARADAALYHAKHSGKNRFYFHPTVWAAAG